MWVGGRDQKARRKRKKERMYLYPLFAPVACLFFPFPSLVIPASFVCHTFFLSHPLPPRHTRPVGIRSRGPPGQTVGLPPTPHMHKIYMHSFVVRHHSSPIYVYIYVYASWLISRSVWFLSPTLFACAFSLFVRPSGPLLPGDRTHLLVSLLVLKMKFI